MGGGFFGSIYFGEYSLPFFGAASVSLADQAAAGLLLTDGPT